MQGCCELKSLLPCVYDTQVCPQQLTMERHSIDSFELVRPVQTRCHGRLSEICTAVQLVYAPVCTVSVPHASGVVIVFKYQLYLRVPVIWLLIC